MTKKQYIKAINSMAFHFHELYRTQGERKIPYEIWDKHINSKLLGGKSNSESSWTGAKKRLEEFGEVISSLGDKIQYTGHSYPTKNSLITINNLAIMGSITT